MKPYLLFLLMAGMSLTKPAGNRQPTGSNKQLAEKILRDKMYDKINTMALHLLTSVGQEEL